MFLTRFAINPARRGARTLLASPHAMHAAVMSGFPPDEPPEPGEGRVLWRLDRDAHIVNLFVLSPSQPDLTHLVEQAGWPTSATWDTRSYAPLLERLAVGQHWAFRLRANPVKQAKDIGKHVGHVTAEQQTAWLVERSARNGFLIPTRADGSASVVVSDRNKATFQRGRDRVTLATARFDGILEIVDLDLFRTTLISGLGRAKGYGCGLITLARPTG